MLRFLSLILFLGLLASSVQAQGERRLGVVDIVTDGLSEKEKKQVLGLLRSEFAEQRKLVVVRKSEIDQLLSEDNPLQAEINADLDEHKNQLAEIQRGIEEAWRLYRASEFNKARTILENAILALRDAALVVELNTVEEVLTLMAACSFFLGDKSGSEVHLKNLLDLSPSSNINAQRFPPPLVETFNRIKASPRFVWKNWVVEGGLAGVKAKIYGRRLTVQPSGILLPLGHSFWGSSSVLLEKDGFAPVLVNLKSLPVRIRFRSVGKKQRPVRGLFAPIQEFVTPPVELKALMADFNLSVVLLALITKDLRGKWVMKGQLLDGRTSVSSPIAARSGSQMRRTARNLVKDLLRFVSPSGEVLKDLKIGSSRIGEPFEESLESSSQEYYQTWWFWPLVGVAVAGAGAGGYLLFKPGDSLKFSVQEAN